MMSERTRPYPAARHAHDRQSQQTADRIGEAIRFPISVAQRVLPDRELPVYLAMGALAVVGVIDWPVAAATGLGYAALRRWGGATTRQPEQRVEDTESRAHRAARVRSDGEVTSRRRAVGRR